MKIIMIQSSDSDHFKANHRHVTEIYKVKA